MQNRPSFMQTPSSPRPALARLSGRLRCADHLGPISTALHNGDWLVVYRGVELVGPGSASDGGHALRIDGRARPALALHPGSHDRAVSDAQELTHRLGLDPRADEDRPVGYRGAHALDVTERRRLPRRDAGDDEGVREPPVGRVARYLLQLDRGEGDRVLPAHVDEESRLGPEE